MAKGDVKIKYGIEDKLPSVLDTDTLYFTTDTHKIFKGNEEYTGKINNVVINTITDENGVVNDDKVSLTITYKDGSRSSITPLLSQKKVNAIIDLFNSKANDTTKGLVTLSDTVDTNDDITKGVAATPKAVINYVDEVTSLGYAYMGIAITSTTPKNTLRKMFYLASQSGDYSKFGLKQVTKGDLLMWNGRSWSIESIGVMTISGSIVQELGANHDKVMSQASVTAEIKNTLKKFAWKDINK